MTFADTRQQIADIIRNDAEWSTFAFPPMTPTPMSVVLEPDDPYIQSSNAHVSLSARMRLRVRIYLTLFDNSGNLEQMEQLAVRLRKTLLDNVWNVGDLSAPTVVETDSGILLTAYLPIEILTEWSTQ